MMVLQGILEDLHNNDPIGIMNGWTTVHKNSLQYSVWTKLNRQMDWHHPPVMNDTFTSSYLELNFLLYYVITINAIW